MADLAVFHRGGRVCRRQKLAAHRAPAAPGRQRAPRRLCDPQPLPPERAGAFVRGADLLDGTPIFDIKPYLPYVDAYPDARGGFTDTTKEYALQVVCPDALLCKVPENKRAALSGVLKNDPRPAYQHDPERVYTLDFGCNKVKFTVDGDILKVVDIL